MKQCTHTIKPSKNKAGYTLTELLVVLVILGLVMGLIAPKFIGQIGGARTKTAAAQVTNLASAVEFFYLDMGRYPSTLEGLTALLSPPPDSDTWNGPYLKRGKTVPNDPWKNPYIYEVLADGSFVIRSLGADAKEGGDGENRDHNSNS